MKGCRHYVASLLVSPAYVRERERVRIRVIFKSQSVAGRHHGVQMMTVMQSKIASPTMGCPSPPDTEGEEEQQAILVEV